MKTPQQTPPNVNERNERLKVALQANIVRRKAQSRARDVAAKDAAAKDAAAKDAAAKDATPKDQAPAGTQDPQLE